MDIFFFFFFFSVAICIELCFFFMEQVEKAIARSNYYRIILESTPIGLSGPYRSRRTSHGRLGKLVLGGAAWL